MLSYHQIPIQETKAATIQLQTENDRVIQLGLIPDTFGQKTRENNIGWLDITFYLFHVKAQFTLANQWQKFQLFLVVFSLWKQRATCRRRNVFKSYKSLFDKQEFNKVSNINILAAFEEIRNSLMIFLLKNIYYECYEEILSKRKRQRGWYSERIQDFQCQTIFEEKRTRPVTGRSLRIFSYKTQKYFYITSITFTLHSNSHSHLHETHFNHSDKKKHTLFDKIYPFIVCILYSVTSPHLLRPAGPCRTCRQSGSVARARTTTGTT